MNQLERDQLLEGLPFDPRKVSDPELVLPDLTEAVEGWRTWSVKRDVPRFGLAPKLRSATNDYYWTPGRAAKAECNAGWSGQGPCVGDELPGENCSCGFYSAKSARHLLSMGYHHEYRGSDEVSVIGKVACWGKVIEGTQGWRSTYAYPVQLYVPFHADQLAQPLRDGYGCKVAVLDLSKLKRGAA